MKTYNGLYERLCSLDNLFLAAHKAQRGKRYRQDVAEFHLRLEDELLDLREELQAQTYRPRPYHTFWIRDSKPRLISAAPYRDRVVHHALCNVTEPLFERTFIHDSYACRVGKGTHASADRLQQFSRQARYVLRCDIRKYFPSIDHEILKQLLRRKIRDPQMLWLWDTIIDGSNPQEEVLQYFPGDHLFTPLERRKGLPIGNQTSQFLANVYLNPLDHFVKDTWGCPRYLRYVDDFAAFGNDKGELHDLR